MIEEAGKRRALRRGDWKYIAASNANNKRKRGAGPAAELYNLKNDPSESKNLMMTHPEKAKSLDAELTALMASSGVK